MFSYGISGVRWCALVLVALGVSPAWAVDPQVIQVEEDWELVIAQPDAGNVAPQITCAISPRCHLDNLYATIEFNHKTVPSYATGGVHLQTWSGDYNLSRRDTANNAKLATAGETIAWTTRMKLENYAITFSIQNGQSTTWGTFGSGLNASYGSSLTSLNAYSPGVSVENSGVGYASNRVTSLTLKRVRYTLADGQVFTDDEPRVVHTLAN